MSQVKV